MLIRFDGEEVSIAICQEGRLVELYLPQSSENRLPGAIYKGRVVNILPGMQAAFVDIGLEKNAQRELEAVLKLEPGNATAKELLRKIRWRF